MCDTFVAFSSVTENRSVIFGNNSDREPNEAQCLEYHPARAYKYTMGVAANQRFYEGGLLLRKETAAQTLFAEQTFPRC